MSDHTPRLLDVMDAFEDGVYIVSDDYTIEYMNKYIRELFGEGIGKKCHTVINKSDMPCPWCQYDKIFTNNESHHSRVHIKCVNKTFHLSELPVANQDGSKSKLSIFRDITQSVHQEKRFESSKESYQRLFNHLGCGVFISSQEGRFLDVNPAMLEMLGYQDKDEFLSLDLAIDVYLTPEDRRKYTSIMEKRGKVVDYEVKWRRRDGHILDLWIASNVRYGIENEIIGYEGIVVDQTQRKQRLQVERELADARQHLLQSEKLAAMGRLTSQLAHELNNPLFGIMNTLELMKTEISPQNKRRKLLDMSLSEIMRLADMLKKMLSFSKPDQAKHHEIDINVVIDELMLIYEKRFKENSIDVKFDLVEDPVLIMASRDQLRQVFINMFSNAMYAMPDGGELKITTKINNKMLYIIIEDTGTGIKPEHLKKVFDSFFTTKTESIQGIGLGMSVCYGVVKEHGGDIMVESEEGKWTKFTITLPMTG